MVINGAAVISMLPIRMPAEAKLGAAVAFLLGILAALGAAIRSLYSFKRVSVAAGTMLGYWLTVLDDGPRLEALETTMKRHMDQAIGSRGTHVLVFGSVAAFLVGCAGGLGNAQIREFAMNPGRSPLRPCARPSLAHRQRREVFGAFTGRAQVRQKARAPPSPSVKLAILRIVALFPPRRSFAPHLFGIIRGCLPAAQWV